MSAYDFDLFVIGGGSGGVRGARMAAATGAKVGLAESYRYGGTCVIRGCVPKKLMSYASHFHEDFEDAVGFGWTVGETSFDWNSLIANKDKEIDRLEGIYQKLLDNAGVKSFRAHAELIDPHTVQVGDQRITAETILIATGGSPSFPPGEGWEHAISSNEAFHLTGLPKRALVYGGGFIAVEFAGIFNGMGSDVKLVYRGEQILRGFDDDVRNTLAEEIVKKGISLQVQTTIEKIEKGGDGLLVTLSDGTTVETDLVMAATGRRPNIKNLGLEAAGVKVSESGAIEVDAQSRTSQSNIFAVGDVTDRINLTPVAIQEAMAFVDTVYRGNPRAMNHEDVPSAVFSHPPVSTVGLSEADARKTYGPVDIYRSNFRPMKHTLSGRDEKTMMKLVVDRASQRVVGVHMVGLDAPEIVQGLAVAVKAGATKQMFDATVGIHPTAAEEFVTMREPVPEAIEKAAE
ncbi:glutathione-disulfide reductase [Denitrobaculum tricleocarpae]|uniref:Glutathione reductase n=1 Tax=Denitrobaculum tricleocarpae TaxID=2591009 RepID=A0A545TU61_9PROT|nr:glutathione-disulfide reductase [Denitrobaculum tricleocarpae]TQV80756.1 glutathione-disulfide reductase [Denitrobaculum tricleocarpae]